MSARTTPESCRRYEHCSANVCPLDPDWRLRRHLEGERVCGYLTELAKPGGMAVLTPVLPAEHLAAMVQAYPEVVATVGPIRRQLRRSAKNGSRVASAARLRGTAA